jgi:hypothetical protein
MASKKAGKKVRPEIQGKFVGLAYQNETTLPDLALVADGKVFWVSDDRIDADDIAYYPIETNEVIGDLRVVGSYGEIVLFYEDMGYVDAGGKPIEKTAACRDAKLALYQAYPPKPQRNYGDDEPGWLSPGGDLFTAYPCEHEILAERLLGSIYRKLGNGDDLVSLGWLHIDTLGAARNISFGSEVQVAQQQIDTLGDMAAAALESGLVERAKNLHQSIRDADVSGQTEQFLRSGWRDSVGL